MIHRTILRLCQINVNPRCAFSLGNKKNPPEEPAQAEPLK